jgi:hypothetical protein
MPTKEGDWTVLDHEAIFVHEIGHGIFHDSFVSWVAASVGEEKAAKRAAGFNYDSPDWYSNIETTLNPMATKLGIPVNELRKMFYDSDFLRSSYEELFSDLLVALYSRDPLIMETSLNKLYGTNPRRENRRFAETAGTLESTTSDNAHEFLQPVRAYIGKIFFSKGYQRDHSKSKLLLNTVFKISSKWILDMRTEKIKISNSREVQCQRFIDLLNTELTLVGLIP